MAYTVYSVHWVYGVHWRVFIKFIHSFAETLKCHVTLKLSALFMRVCKRGKKSKPPSHDGGRALAKINVALNLDRWAKIQWFSMDLRSFASIIYGVRWKGQMKKKINAKGSTQKMRTDTHTQQKKDKNAYTNKSKHQL